MRIIVHATLAALLLALAAPALAVYKCEANGRTSYRDTPCAGGSMLHIDSAPPPDVTDQRQLREEKAEAARLEKARHKREALQSKKREQARKALAARRRKCATLALHRKWAEEDAQSARLKTAATADRKARRAEEAYQAACSG